MHLVGVEQHQRHQLGQAAVASSAGGPGTLRVAGVPAQLGVGGVAERVQPVELEVGQPEDDAVVPVHRLDVDAEPFAHPR